MDYDQDKVDEITLALLWLTTFKDPVGKRAWKGQDWDTMERLHTKGYISDPKSKAKSIVLSDEVKSGRGSCLRSTSPESVRFQRERTPDFWLGKDWRRHTQNPDVHHHSHAEKLREYGEHCTRVGEDFTDGSRIA